MRKQPKERPAPGELMVSRCFLDTDLKYPQAPESQYNLLHLVGALEAHIPQIMNFHFLKPITILKLHVQNPVPLPHTQGSQVNLGYSLSLFAITASQNSEAW